MSSHKKTQVYSALLLAGLGLSAPAMAVKTAAPALLAAASAIETNQSILVKVAALQSNYQARLVAKHTAMTQQQLLGLLPATFRSSLVKQKLTIQRIFPMSGLVELTSQQPDAVWTEQVEHLADVSYASVNYDRKTQGAVKRPIDEIYTVLWGLEDEGQYNIGNEAFGLGDRDINAPEAWAIRTDASNVLVAVFDTGTDLPPDLKNHLWVNPGEIESNYVDDDNNGYVDDIYGIAPGNPWAPGSIEDYRDGHGNMVAGIIGAEGDNTIFGAGVAWKAQIMMIKIVNDDSTMPDSNII